MSDVTTEAGRALLAKLETISASRYATVSFPFADEDIAAIEDQAVESERRLLYEAHSGEPHEFRTICRRCGEPGYLHVSLITPDERVEILAPPAEKEQT